MARAKTEMSQRNASFRTSWNTQKFNKREADKRHTEMNIKVIKKKYKKISTYNKYFRKKCFLSVFSWQIHDQPGAEQWTWRQWGKQKTN